MHYICYKYKKEKHLLRILHNKSNAEKASDFYKYTDKQSIYIIVSPETQNMQYFNSLPNWNSEYVNKLYFVANQDKKLNKYTFLGEIPEQDYQIPLKYKCKQNNDLAFCMTCYIKRSMERKYVLFKHTYTLICPLVNNKQDTM